MAFVKGQSGNPAGRPRRTDTEKAQRERIRKALPEIVSTLIEQATQERDVTAAKLLLERVMPAYRPTDRAAPIPLDGDTLDLSSATDAVLRVLVAGDRSPDRAAAVAGVLATLARVQEIAEIDARLTALEHSNGHKTDSSPAN